MGFVIFVFQRYVIAFVWYKCRQEIMMSQLGPGIWAVAVLPV
jgi:hypothetical protein